MKRVLTISTVLASSAAAQATPTTNFWAPSTPAVQPYGVLHVGDDTYFATDALYPVDLGLTMGVLPTQKVQLEVGADLVYPTLADTKGLAAPIYFNAKLGAPENAFFAHQPGLALGVYDVGVKPDVTTYDVITGMIGATIPHAGFLSIGGYYGVSKRLMVDRMGNPAHGGFMAGWSSPNLTVPKIDHVSLVADVQTGSNALGGAGGGIDIYFTPTVGLLTGPVVFFEPALQPGGDRWMWSAQLDVDVDLRR